MILIKHYDYYNYEIEAALNGIPDKISLEKLLKTRTCEMFLEVESYIFYAF